MNTASASRDDTPADRAVQASTLRRVPIWDAPVRVFHGLMILCFAGAWLSAESERWRLVHVSLGLTMAGLVAFRVVWGLVGTRHARFSSFVRGPSAVLAYLRGLLQGHPPATPGHNPAGALAILAVLAGTAVLAASGWVVEQGTGGEWIEDLHEAAAHAMLSVVGVHIAGVLLASVLHRENLIGAMLSGMKRARPQDAVRQAWRSVAVLMLVAVLGFWAFQWRSAPAAGANGIAAVARPQGDRDDD